MTNIPKQDIRLWDIFSEGGDALAKDDKKKKKTSSGGNGGGKGGGR